MSASGACGSRSQNAGAGTGSAGTVLLDHANPIFPEAGHPVVGLLSSRLEPYGGIVSQLVFPCVLAVAFWRKGQPLGSQF